MVLELEALDQARSVLRERRDRDARFPQGIFGEPAWDLLLALYIARCEGRHPTMPALCLGMDLLAIDASDWISKLEDSHLVQSGELLGSPPAIPVWISDDAFNSLTTLLLGQMGENANASDFARKTEIRSTQ